MGVGTPEAGTKRPTVAPLEKVRSSDRHRACRGPGLFANWRPSLAAHARACGRTCRVQEEGGAVALHHRAYPVQVNLHAAAVPRPPSPRALLPAQSTCTGLPSPLSRLGCAAAAAPDAAAATALLLSLPLVMASTVMLLLLSLRLRRLRLLLRPAARDAAYGAGEEVVQPAVEPCLVGALQKRQRGRVVQGLAAGCGTVGRCGEPAVLHAGRALVDASRAPTRSRV